MSKIRNLKIGNPQELLKIHNLEGIPDISALISKCNIDLTTFEPSLTKGLENVQGCICVDDSHKTIMINRNTSPIIIRFIAGYLLSYDQLHEVKDSYVLYQESIYDKKVYDFTLDLLMPDSIFDKEKVESYSDVKKLAKKYKVSEFLITEKKERSQKRKRLESKK